MIEGEKVEIPFDPYDEFYGELIRYIDFVDRPNK